MSVLSKIKGLFHKAQPRRGFVQARFDAAQTTADNQKHWAMADQLSADAEASPDVRLRLRIRSRYEVANNSYAKGLVQMLANDTVGTGPRLQVLTSDEGLNDSVEAAFRAWSKAVKLPQKLRTMRMARCQDGEAFAMLFTNPKLPTPEKLDLQLLEADRISSGYVFDERDPQNLGIRFDAYGNPESYTVLTYHPGDPYYSMTGDSFTVKADSMLHIFRQDRPEQHRGIPELTAALPLFAQLRRYNLAALSAAEAAADFAAILYTDSPAGGESADVAPLDSVELNRNMMLTVPAGWKMEQLDSKQPTANHKEFVKCILAEVARCVASTYGAVSGDYSGYNYSSGRMDNQLYQKSIIVDRSLWESEVLDRLFTAWFREYSLEHGLQYEPVHTWFWDAFVHVDPTKEAQAVTVKLANDTTTLAAECAKEGRDYMAVLHQRAREKQIMRELGLTEDGAGSEPPAEDSNDDTIEEESNDQQ